MKIKSYLVAILVFILILYSNSCKIGRSGESKSDPASQKDTARRLANPVETANAVLMDMRSVIRSTGSLEPFQDIKIISKVQGIVENVYFEQGDTVKKGNILLKIDSREYEIALHQAEADLASAKAALNPAELLRAENQYKRIKEMFEKNLSSKQELEQQEALYLQAKSSYESQEARILSLKANYERAKLNLSYATIRSTMDGIVSRRHANTGELISPSSVLYEIVDISKLYARIYISEKYVHYLNKGKVVEVRVDAVPNRTYEGIIDVVSPVAEAQSRTFQTSVLIENKDNTLRAGMFTRVVINVADFKDAVAVPKDAVIVRHDQDYCFVVKGIAEENEVKDEDSQKTDASSTASLIRVQTGVEDARYIQILEGINEGDTVIISGHYELNDGDMVRIIRYTE